MDLVYIVSPDPQHSHIELRHSIRSMVKHISGMDKLVVVGTCPEFLTPDIHIPLEDVHKQNAARNIYDKISAASNHPQVTDHFIYCSEDYFLNQSFIARQIPYFYYNDIDTVLSRIGEKNPYKYYVQATKKALDDRQLPTKYFNVHCPIIYHKQIFTEVMSQYEWNLRKSYISKSLYCNSLKIEGTPMEDCKFHTPKNSIAAIMRKIGNSPFFSTNEFAINDPMKAVLQELYPEKSKWERDYLIIETLI